MKLYVGNLPFSATESEIEELFGEFGQVTSVAPDAAPEEDDASAAAAGSGKPLAGIRVLLAEDGKDNQRLITFHLKKLGASPELTDNGRVAIEAYNALAGGGLTPDGILMDMQMPIMSGYDATRELRTRGYPGQIVALTAHAMEGEMDKCLNAGCDHYLSKPIERGLFLAEVASRIKKPSNRPSAA